MIIAKELKCPKCRGKVEVRQMYSPPPHPRTLPAQAFCRGCNYGWELTTLEFREEVPLLDQRIRL